MIGFLLIFIFQSCEKEGDEIETINDKCYQLTISRNDKVYQVFKFNDDNLLNQINYDTLGIIKEKIYYTYSIQQIKKDFFSKDSVLLSYQIYILNKNNAIDSIFTYTKYSGYSDLNHAYIFLYSDLRELNIIMDKIFSTNEHLDVNFEWDENNVSDKNFPINSGFPQYSYDYDDKPSIYKLLNAPIDVNFATLEIAKIPISTNNIKKISVKRLVNNDFTFDTVKYVLYNSQFVYHSNGFISSELRQYDNELVKFEYKIDTIK